MNYPYTQGDKILAAEYNEVVKSAGLYAADGGSTDAYAITVSPNPSSYLAGITFRFKANTANTGGATLAVNGLSAKTIKKNFSEDLVTGDIIAGQIVAVIYDGTNFQMLSPSAVTANGVIASDNLKVSADNSIGLNDNSYNLVKQVKIAFSGTIRVSFDLATDAAGNQAYGRIYINGVAVGTERLTTSATFQTYTEDITVKAFDTVELKIRSGNVIQAKAKNFRIYYDKTALNDSIIIN